MITTDIDDLMGALNEVERRLEYFSTVKDNIVDHYNATMRDMERAIWDMQDQDPGLANVLAHLLGLQKHRPLDPATDHLKKEVERLTHMVVVQQAVHDSIDKRLSSLHEAQKEHYGVLSEQLEEIQQDLYGES